MILTKEREGESTGLCLQCSISRQSVIQLQSQYFIYSLSLSLSPLPYSMGWK